jgi:hypothetical protein
VLGLISVRVKEGPTSGCRRSRRGRGTRACAHVARCGPMNLSRVVVPWFGSWDLGTICSYSFPFFRVLCLSSISTCKDPIRPDTEFSRMIRPAAESARLTRNRPMPRSSDAPTHGPHVGGAPPAGSKGASQSHLPPGPTCGRPTRSRGAPNLLRCRAPSSASRNLHKFRLFPDADHPSIQPRFRTSCQRG